MVDVIPGITAKDWDEFTSQVTRVAPFTERVHVNISDGSMGIPQSMADVSQLSKVKDTFPAIEWEAHLLTANPEKYIRPLVEAGFTRLTAHVESNDPRRFLDEAKYDDVEVGIAIDGATELEQIEPFLEEVDYVSVMTTEAGVSGGAFLPEAVEKIKLIREHYLDLPIEAVGGITDTTVKAVKDAGATRVVASHYLFSDSANVEMAIATLQNA